MNEEFNRKRGAPMGNQNARKHGFYSSVLTAADKRNLKKAAEVEGLDEEIDLVRVKLKSLAANDSANISLISQASISLARLLRTRIYLNKHDPNSLKRAVGHIIRDIAIPLGIDMRVKESKFSDKPGEVYQGHPKPQ